MPSPYDENPYLAGLMQAPEKPHWTQTLGNLLTNVGAGIGMASAGGRHWGAGIAPGLAMASQAMQGDEDRRFRQSMAVQQAQQAAAYRKAQMDAMQGKADAEKQRMALGGQLASALGFNVQPDPVRMGPQTAAVPANQDEFVNMMMPHALAVSQATGVDPRLVIAQSALETGWGKAAPGNNYFGIKSHGRAGGQDLATNEVGAGGLYRTTDSFRTYGSPAQSAQDYAEFLKTNGRYAPVLQAKGLDAQIDAMGKSGYATDPNYAAKLRQIAQGLPVNAGGPQVAQGGGELGGGLPGGGPPPSFVQQLPPEIKAAIGTAYARGDIDGGNKLLIDAYKNTQKVDAWTPLTPNDVKMYGFQPREGVVYQRNRSTGEIKATGSPLVDINQQNESEAQRVQIQSANKFHLEQQDAAKTARSGLSQVNRLSSLMDQLNTGKFTTTTNEVMAIAKSFGIDLGALGIKDTVGVAQAADALSKQLALSMRDPSAGGGMPGALSNADRDYLARMIPTLETTPEGRKLMVDYARRMYQRQIEQAKIANEYIRSKQFREDPSGMFAKLQEHADANPLFSAEDEKALAGMPQGAAPAPSPAPAPQTAPPGSLQMPAPPPEAAIKHLQMNPALREQFDKKYGPGSAAKVLGK